MDLDLKNIEWREFFLKDVFTEIQRGKRLKKSDHQKGNMPYVSSTSYNNGVDGFVGNTEKVRVFSDCLTIANSGSVGSAFFQPFEFVGSDHVTALQNEKFTKYIYQFIAVACYKLSEKYSFNREISDKRIKREKILLPADTTGKPDYAFMETFMRQKEQKQLAQYHTYIKKRLKQLKNDQDIEPLHEKKWSAFEIANLFNVKIGKNVDGNKVNKKNGDTAYITRKESDNGLDGFINFEHKFLNEAFPVITIGNETAQPFVQTFPFFTGTKVNILEHKQEISAEALRFISRCLEMHKNKYSYSFTINSTRLKRQKILLPINANQEPDYPYMENYIKRLEYEKLTQFLEYKNK